MQTRYALAAGMAALLALGAAAQAASTKTPADPKGRQCFYTRDVDGFAAPDDHTVNVRVGVHDVYQLELMGTCPDVNWSERIALVSKPGSWICSALDAEIVTRAQGLGPQHCPVKTLRKLTPDEIAALPKHGKP